MCEGLLTDGLSCGDAAGDQSEQPGVTHPPWDAPWEVATQMGLRARKEEALSHGSTVEGPTDCLSARSQKQQQMWTNTRTGTAELTAEPWTHVCGCCGHGEAVRAPGAGVHLREAWGGCGRHGLDRIEALFW